MWKLILCALLLLGDFALPAATVQLKDKASVSGKILAEKADQIVIDIGYTVLVIPRNQILSLLKDKTPGAEAPAETLPAPVITAPETPPLAPSSPPPPPGDMDSFPPQPGPSKSGACANWPPNWARPSSRCGRPPGWARVSSSTRTASSSPTFT